MAVDNSKEDARGRAMEFAQHIDETGGGEELSNYCLQCEHQFNSTKDYEKHISSRYNLGASIIMKANYNPNMYSVHCDSINCCFSDRSIAKYENHLSHNPDHVNKLLNGDRINVRISDIGKFNNRKAFHCQKCLKGYTSIYARDTHSKKCMGHGENTIIYFFYQL